MVNTVTIFLYCCFILIISYLETHHFLNIQGININKVLNTHANCMEIFGDSAQQTTAPTLTLGTECKHTFRRVVVDVVVNVVW
jgi:hypothetical protein